jgi:hypothetical protein
MQLLKKVFKIFFNYKIMNIIEEFFFFLDVCRNFFEQIHPSSYDDEIIEEDVKD